MGWVVIFLFGFAFGLALFTARRSKKQSQELVPSITEYWVYADGSAVVPSTEAVMSRMVPALITPREGALFTDIKLHVGVVQREKEPTCFRPDAADGAELVGDNLLGSLADSQQLVRLMYASPVAPADDRHLKFMPALAIAYGELLTSKAIYDVVAKTLYGFEQFAQAVKSTDLFEFNVKVKKKYDEDGDLRVITCGLAKWGLPEIVTHPISSDESWLVEQVIEKVARTMFTETNAHLPPAHMMSIDVATDYDSFRVNMVKASREPIYEARVHRMRESA